MSSPAKILRAILFASLFLIVAPIMHATENDLEAMKRTVREKFPEVQQISTGELWAWLNNSKREQPVLLDVRTEKEFLVSHLHGAMRVDPAAKASDLLPLLRSGRPIVAYCSVGYRSSALAERLKKAGGTLIFDLEGSIFQWANEGRPLEADGHPTRKVHPYNSKYGKMLDEDKRSKM